MKYRATLLLLGFFLIVAALVAVVMVSGRGGGVHAGGGDRDLSVSWGTSINHPVRGTPRDVMISATTTNPADMAIDIEVKLDGAVITGAYGVDGDGEVLDDPADPTFALEIQTGELAGYPAGTQFTVVATYLDAENGTANHQESIVTTKP